MLRGNLLEKEKGVFHSDRGTLCASAQITAFTAAKGLTRTSHAHHLKALYATTGATCRCALASGCWTFVSAGSKR